MATPFEIYVGHMDISVTEQMLRERFSAYGQILEYTRPSQSFCYLYYDSLSSAASAVENENGKLIGEKKLLVKCRNKSLPAVDQQTPDSHCVIIVTSDEFK
jgi:RNA recognition motif. (a.k.a. RRM, RBD, or RNP domain)